MKPFIRKKLPYILIAVQVVLILGLLIYIVPGRYRLYDIVLYDASENVPANPLIGYAPDAARQEDCADADLVFLTVPFSEWEPEEGRFDTEGIGKKYHIDEYRAAGKHAVLRFVCDLPDEEGKADIPEWLRTRTGDGRDYEDASGRGYAPAYENKIFEEAHRTALEALAKWCGQDSFVSYVEIGSIGKNGVWTETGEGAAAPSARTCETYLDQYREAFAPYESIRLLYSGNMAEPETAASADPAGAPDQKSGQDPASQDAAAQDSFSPGTWMDVLGDADAASAWRQSLVEGKPEKEGSSETPALWTRGPVGGGLTQSVPMDDLLMDHLSDTLEQVRSCHVSFIGPVCPDAEQQQTNGSDMILRDVGYCVYLSRLQTTVDFIDDDLVFHFTFENIGQAPLYWDWPVTMYVYDRDGTCIREQVLDLKMSGLTPGIEETVNGTVPYSRDLLKGYSVGLSITSPDGEDYVTFAQKGVLPDAEGIHTIYRYKSMR